MPVDKYLTRALFNDIIKNSLLGIISKILISIEGKRRWLGEKIRGLYKHPSFYFGLFILILFFGIYVACGDSSRTTSLKNNRIVFFGSYFHQANKQSVESLFSSPKTTTPLETPDLKIIQDNTLGRVATPYVVTAKVLGDIFGSSDQNKKEIIDYVVQPGDTLQSIADAHRISLNTLLWANDLTVSSSIKVGQTLTILPTDGVLHIVKPGDTISAISKTYKAEADSIISYNDLTSQNDIYIGDILIIPDGIMPKSRPPISVQNAVADNFFIFPTQGIISQGLHFYNAIDIANKCGTPIYAAAAGVVQRAVGNNGWNKGMGNYITIRHSNGTVTYYGHLMSLLVGTGDSVYTGQNIGFMGGAPGMAGAGISTGCHLHFEVIGARNPLSVYQKGALISYNK